MRFHISHYEVKRTNMLYYVYCTVDFTEQEQAIIRVRNLHNNTIEFKSGFVDYLETTEGLADAGFIFNWAKIAGVVFLISLFFNSNLSALLFLITAALTGWGFYRRYGQTKEYPRTVTIGTMLQRRFSVCGMNDPRLPKVIESEVITAMQGLKTFLADARQFPNPSSHEI